MKDLFFKSVSTFIRSVESQHLIDRHLDLLYFLH